MTDPTAGRSRGGSPSLAHPDYWWYRARQGLLRSVFDGPLHDSSARPVRALDVGSADGPSDFWEGRDAEVIAVDPDPRGLAGSGVCAALPDLPFPDACFDVVTAFDVIEHCDDEDAAVEEVHRVLAPGGLFLMTVPAYQWAWTAFDDQNGHHRRYTRPRAVSALAAGGFTVLRSTHAFTTVFPLFVVQRLANRVAERWRGKVVTTPADVVAVPHVPPVVDRALVRACQLDERMLRSCDLPFGSSVFVAATKSSPGSPRTAGSPRVSDATT